MELLEHVIVLFSPRKYLLCFSQTLSHYSGLPAKVPPPPWSPWHVSSAGLFVILGFCSDYNDPHENYEKSHCSFGSFFPDDEQHRAPLCTPVGGKVYSRAVLAFQSIYWEWKERGYRIWKRVLENDLFILVEKAGSVWAAATQHAGSALPIC